MSVDFYKTHNVEVNLATHSVGVNLATHSVGVDLATHSVGVDLATHSVGVDLATHSVWALPELKHWHISLSAPVLISGCIFTNRDEFSFVG